MEVLIALFILGALGAALLTALNTNARATRTLDEQVVATNLATAYLEEIRDTPYAHSYPNVGNTIPKPPQMKLLLTLTSVWLRAVLPSSPGWCTNTSA
jgi:type II secretory pathway pseudopilin PulG